MLDYEQISIAFKLIELISKDERKLASTQSFGDWLQHLREHLDYSLEE